MDCVFLSERWGRILSDWEELCRLGSDGTWLELRRRFYFVDEVCAGGIYENVWVLLWYLYVVYGLGLPRLKGLFR